MTFDLLEAPRAFFGMVQSGTFALVVGGTSPSEEQVEFLDLLEWESRLFSEDIVLSDLGETRAASIDEAEILVLPSNTGPFIFNMFDVTRRITPVVLPNGQGRGLRSYRFPASGRWSSEANSPAKLNRRCPWSNRAVT